jgi:hypothetical protein
MHATVSSMLEIRNGDSWFIPDLLPSNLGGDRIAGLKTSFDQQWRKAA